MKSPCICIHPQNRPCGRDCDGKPSLANLIDAAGEDFFGSAWPSPTAGTINPPTAEKLSSYQRIELERLEAQLVACLKALREVLGRS
jgi:hypothetical protein